MAKVISMSALRTMCLLLLVATASAACRHGGKGKWVFQGSDGMRIEQGYPLCMLDTPGLSELPKDATGTLQWFLPSGQMIGDYQLSNGVQHGTARLWNAKGQLIMDASYSNGRLDGLYATWHDNGTKASEELFRDGREEGRHIAWYETGTVKTDAEYATGLLNGRYRSWMPDGNIVSDGVYSNMWPQSGTVILEWIEGRPPTIGVYRDGILIQKRRWQEPQ
jgi:hypothetical protein